MHVTTCLSKTKHVIHSFLQKPLHRIRIFLTSRRKRDDPGQLCVYQMAFLQLHSTASDSPAKKQLSPRDAIQAPSRSHNPRDAILAVEPSCHTYRTSIRCWWLLRPRNPDPNVIVCARSSFRSPIAKVSVHIQCAQMLQCCSNTLLQALHNLRDWQKFQHLLTQMFRGQQTTGLVTLPHITNLQSFHQKHWPWWNFICIESQIVVLILFCLVRRPLGTLQLLRQTSIRQLRQVHRNLLVLRHLAFTPSLQHQLQLMMRKQTLPIHHVIVQAILVWFVWHRFHQPRSFPHAQPAKLCVHFSPLCRCQRHQVQTVVLNRVVPHTCKLLHSFWCNRKLRAQLLHTCFHRQQRFSMCCRRFNHVGCYVKLIETTHFVAHTDQGMPTESERCHASRLPQRLFQETVHGQPQSCPASWYQQTCL